MARNLDQTPSDEVLKRRNDLFNKWVKPYFRMIYKLTIQYSSNRQNVEENFYEVLTNMYKYIETYNPERSIHTWLHIVTKRHVFSLERQRYRSQKRDDDKGIEVFGGDKNADDYLDENGHHVAVTLDNWRSAFSDDITYALECLDEKYRNPIILQLSGYKLKEIAQEEYNRGSLPVVNEKTIKSRLFLARKQLKAILTRDGEYKNGAFDKAYTYNPDSETYEEYDSVQEEF